jgi:uncharacterized protein (TIGR02680 family)
MQETFDLLSEWSTTEQSIAEQTLTQQIDLLQAFAGGPNGYRLRRVLLTNFWLYGQQEFEILHGRLFLAGENASGKSTVLTAALPLALDGDIRPNRLDTFGGRERHIEYYVLGGTESATPFNFERRTSYIALEFEWCNPDMPPISQELRQRWENGDRESTRFLTIGVSLAGNVNASDRIRPLRFLITDGSRLGYDIHTTYETGNKHDKRAYDHSRFKQVMEGHGIVCDTRDEYEQKVARYLFGYSDVKDFQKLITLLLVLRRPNLSTELSFSKVHDFLKMSLRKISGETTQRVIGTIERIDAINTEIEHLQDAYNGTERLHSVLQQLSTVEAQFAASEFIEAQQVENAAQAKTSRQRRELHNAEQERDKAGQLTQALQAEQQQVSGSIKALEASEGLQVAEQLATARERTRNTFAQQHMQEENLAAAQQSILSSQQSVERQQGHFARTKTESAAQLQELRHIASDEALWETAAFSLEEAVRQVQAIAVETETAPEIPTGIPAMLEDQAEERTIWLRHLEDLHKQREKLESRIQHARDYETTRFQELDEASRRFQDAKDIAYAAQQKLATMLEAFGSSEEIDAMLAATLDSLDEQALSDVTGDEALTTHVVEHFAALLNGYRQAIDMLDAELTDLVDQLQGELDELQLLVGGKRREVEENQILYEQKLAEPEYTPQHPTRRSMARTKLAEKGISALPLYALLDFAPEIESEEAGRVEHMLEDAGLLDALVIAPHQKVAAEKFLVDEDLSDCRLDVTHLQNTVHSSFAGNLSQWLRFDTAVNENEAENQQIIDWKSIAETVLAALGGNGENNRLLSMREDGMWQHGLLAGHAGQGAPTFIGKANRMRVRQSELDALQERQLALNAELQQLYSQIGAFEQRRTVLQEKQNQLHKVLASSGIEDTLNKLSIANSTLDEARSKYNKARVQTQEVRQQFNSLLVQLERESNGIGALASDAKQVQNALIGTIKLKNQAKSLHIQLAAIESNWEEYRRALAALENARTNTAQVSQLHAYARNQFLSAQAEEQELQHIAELTNVLELSERLRTLRERFEALYNEIDEAKGNFIRSDERSQNLATSLGETEEQLASAQANRTEKQQLFLSRLALYPVEQLLQTQQATKGSSSNILRAAQDLLGEKLRESGTLAQKEYLEGQRRTAYNRLLQAFNQEQHLLHDYGPNLDASGQVQFLYENKSNPAELLGILSERIEMQKTLLGQKERQLFEDFLLQEIAEAIRTHILEAEEWIQQINGVLKSLPMIGEHYELTWRPPAEYDMEQLGSHLARHYKLLRKPAQTLTEEETETLMDAFRQEIATVREKQKEDASINFMDMLEQIFDYREWFHFDVWVTPTGGQRQRLTDRLAGTRSGAEQLFALYVPLFAALAALYNTAAPGAPRLLALDEAFDKVSVTNTQRIMEFLVSQHFQWIMTGPQVSGTGEHIPASSRYLMIHEKGSPFATASASFWVGHQGFKSR